MTQEEDKKNKAPNEDRTEFMNRLYGAVEAFAEARDIASTTYESKEEFNESVATDAEREPGIAILFNAESFSGDNCLENAGFTASIKTAEKSKGVALVMDWQGAFEVFSSDKSKGQLKWPDREKAVEFFQKTLENMFPA